MVFGNCRGKTVEMGWWSWCMNVCSWRFSPDFWAEIKKKAKISLALAYHSSNFWNFLSINAVKYPHSWDSLISPAWDRTCFILTDLGASHIVKYNSPWLVFDLTISLSISSSFMTTINILNKNLRRNPSGNLWRSLLLKTLWAHFWLSDTIFTSRASNSPVRYHVVKFTT